MRRTVTHLCPPQLQKNALVQGTKVLVRKTPTHSSTTSANAFAFVARHGRGEAFARQLSSWSEFSQLRGRSHHLHDTTDRVHADYFVKTSKNEFFKVSEGRLCYWALFFSLATVCTDFPCLTYYSTSLRAHSHYVKFGLTRLRFSKFPWQRKKMAKTRRQTHLRQRRGGACVDAVASAFFAFLVVWWPRRPFVESSWEGKLWCRIILILES